jgi:hypothetical protein
VTEPQETSTSDEGAAALGRLGRVLGGAVSDAEGAAGRERLFVALAKRRTPRLRLALLAALVSVTAAAAAFFFVQKTAPLDYRVSGPLVVDEGWLSVAGDRGAVSLGFSEGTEIELGPGSKGRVAEVTSSGARVVLGKGRLRARVVHVPRARWAVAAGPYSIEVTGTAFDVGWEADGERLELVLHDGSVVVHGPSLHDGIRVAAGQRLVAHGRTGGAELSSSFVPENRADPPGTAASAHPEPVSDDPERPETTVARPSPTWSELVAAGNFRAVLDAAKARGEGATLTRGSLADLTALADAARYGGDPALARRGLLAQRARFPASSAAHAAAFVLGRMADDGGSPAEALRFYDGYLSEAPSGSFAAEALGRKLVVLVNRGDTAGARAVAATYLKRFPRGGHAAYAREVLPGP